MSNITESRHVQNTCLTVSSSSLIFPHQGINNPPTIINSSNHKRIMKQKRKKASSNSKLKCDAKKPRQSIVTSRMPSLPRLASNKINCSRCNTKKKCLKHFTQK